MSHAAGSEAISADCAEEIPFFCHWLPGRSGSWQDLEGDIELQEHGLIVEFVTGGFG